MATTQRKNKVEKSTKKHPLVGNKFAIGNHGGRPPNDSDEELIKFGIYMLECIEKNSDWWFIQDFAVFAKIPSKVIYNHSDRKVFKDYYERAKEILGLRIIRATEKRDEKGKLIGIHSSLANRFLNTYFHDVKASEKDMKREVAEQVRQTIQVIYKGTMDDNVGDRPKEIISK